MADTNAARQIPAYTDQPDGRSQVAEGPRLRILPMTQLAPAAPAQLEATPELLAELAEASARLESATPEEIIAWGHERFAPYLTMATAFGPEGCVILSMLAKVAPETYVFNLDTGYQFLETLDTRDRIARKYGIEVDLLQPELTVPEYEAKHGGPLYKTNPDQCCFDRKIKVLQQASRGKHAWMSGIRRDQSEHRAAAAIVGWDKKFQLVKISPLANWTKKDVWKRIVEEDVPYNPLHDRGYPSIGCWPCTRAVAAGEDDGDERAGRWSGTGKVECGLHTISESDGSGI
ncbi:MAG: phosphoadenylyl-sulfate reductase [Planctomycetaceae bacterium]|nr:phosphoadenylyl-sulfate reductase [Planctomycetaceae bacterium]